MDVMVMAVTTTIMVTVTSGPDSSALGFNQGRDVVFAKLKTVTGLQIVIKSKTKRRTPSKRYFERRMLVLFVSVLWVTDMFLHADTTRRTELRSRGPAGVAPGCPISSVVTRASEE